MLETFLGIMLTLASGLIGRDTLLREQPSLKITLHHLEAYQDIIGLCCLIGGIFGLYHGASTAISTTYSPLYWLAWSGSNLIASLTGLTLCFIVVEEKIKEFSTRLHQFCMHITTTVAASPDRLCWLGLTLGTWRALNPWLSA